MTEKCEAPPIEGGATRDCFGGWSRLTTTLATALAQPPAMPRLIALHLGAETISMLAIGGLSNV